MKPRQRSTALAAISLVLLGLAGCSSKSDKTSLVVRVESDLAVGIEIDTVVVDGHAFSIASAADLPVAVGFTPSSTSNASMVVTATARWRGTDVVEQSIAAAFQPGAAVLVVMHLDRACISKNCGADQTCEDGNCGPTARTPTPYPGSTDGGDTRLDSGKSIDTGDAVSGNDRGADTSVDGGGPGDVAIDDVAGTDAREAGPTDTAAPTDGSSDTGGNADSSDARPPDLPVATCGDGVVDHSVGETCDYLGGEDHADCNGVGAPPLLRCRAPACGDEYVNFAAGEACEVASNGGDSTICNGVAAGPGRACKTTACGDGYVNGAAGESCDDGNNLSGDGCSFPGCMVEPGFGCTTPGQPCHATCGDGQIRGSEACDDFNASNCGTCDATCMTLQSLVGASGSIVAVSGTTSLRDGETFTISDGRHPSVTFEFSNAVAAPGHVQIARTGDAVTVAAKIANAVNGSGLTITAAASSSQVSLTNIVPGAAGNVEITETVLSTSFVVDGMSGGVAYDCAAGVGCGAGSDCASGVCCLTGTRNGLSCVKNTCLAASCTDGVLNGTETDVDCGGGLCPACS